MASDQLVDAQDVLRAILKLRRKGISQSMSELEAIEPDLTEFVLEEPSGVHSDLMLLGGPSKQVRRLHARVQSLLLVVVESLRLAQQRLWQQDSDDQAPPQDPLANGQHS